jgi:hypothetical protein
MQSPRPLRTKAVCLEARAGVAVDLEAMRISNYLWSIPTSQEPPRFCCKANSIPPCHCSQHRPIRCRPRELGAASAGQGGSRNGVHRLAHFAGGPNHDRQLLGQRRAALHSGPRQSVTRLDASSPDAGEREGSAPRCPTRRVRRPVRRFSATNAIPATDRISSCASMPRHGSRKSTL